MMRMKTVKLFSFFVAAMLLVTVGTGSAYTVKSGIMIALDEVEWHPAREGSPVDIAVLSGDPATGAHVRLVRLPAGFVAPIHAHTGDYNGVNLTGIWKHTFVETGEVRELPPGSYVFQPGGEMHGDACIGPEDCILLLQQSEAADFIVQE